MDSPYDVVDPRGGYGKADVQLACPLRDGDDADIVAGHDGEQSAEDSARAFHSGTKNRDYRNVTVHGDRIQDSMLEFGAEQSLERVDHSFRVRLPED